MYVCVCGLGGQNRNAYQGNLMERVHLED
jgi:hypothetical protein